jgi:hypothetical protein
MKVSSLDISSSALDSFHNKLLRCEANHSPLFGVEVSQYVELYLSSPIRHGVVLS